MNANRVLALLSLTLLLGVGSAYGWVVRYDGPAHTLDKAAAIAADAAGDIYVTGYSTGSGSAQDYLTVKYNAATGETLWVRRYSSPGATDDEAVAIACDASGYVCVTGFATGTSADYLTIRYNAATGDTVWTRRYNGPGNGEDKAAAIAVDDSGNVYVTGYARVNAHSEAVTIKYNSAGSQQWLRRVYSTIGDSNAVATALAVSRTREVYICGRWRGTSGFEDFLTARITPAGDTAWVRRYNGPRDSTDWAFALAVDDSGNVVTTGASWGTGTEFDYATIKYSLAGVQRWVTRYDGTDHTEDTPAAIALDPAYNVYVTGLSTSNHFEDYLTVKYSPTGAQLWTARFDGNTHGDDNAHAIVVRDSQVYVTGFSESGNDFDFLTAKYDTGGGLLWTSRWDHSPAHDEDQAMGLVVPAPFMVYVTGFSYDDNNGFDYVTMKMAEHDIGVVQFLRPLDTLPPQPVVPEVRIYNYGVTSETVTVYLSIHRGNQPVYSDAVTVYDIGPNSDYDVSFKPFMGGEGDYTMHCSVELAGDLNHVNDTLTGFFTFKWTVYPYWTSMPNVPGGPLLKMVKDGGALCYGRYSTSNFSVFALKGNNTNEFYRYHVSGDTWHMCGSVPYSPYRAKRVKKGAALVYDRYDSLVFCLKGNNTDEFWKYNAIQDSWMPAASMPLGTSGKKVKGGAGLALYRVGSTGDNYVYALKGGKTDELWCYHVQTDSWMQKRSVPLGLSLKGMGDGSALVNGGGTLYALKGGYNELYAYLPTEDSWAARMSMPLYNSAGRKKKVKMGGALCYGNGVAYGLKGGGTCEFWGYFPLADTWVQMESVPRLPTGKTVKGGGALAFGNSLVWALKGNKTLDFYTYNPGSDFLGGRLPDTDGVAALRTSATDGWRLTIVPNPVSSGFATVRLSSSSLRLQPSSLSVYDAVGRLVLHSSFVIRNSSFSVDLRSMSNGVYLVRVTGEGFTATQKLIIQR